MNNESVVRGRVSMSFFDFGRLWGYAEFPIAFVNKCLCKTNPRNKLYYENWKYRMAKLRDGRA